MELLGINFLKYQTIVKFVDKTGIDTFAFQSEAMYPDDLSFLNNYNNKVILYDNDTAGYEGSMKLQSTLETSNYKKVKNETLPSSDPEAIRCGSILLNCTDQQRFSCS